MEMTAEQKNVLKGNAVLATLQLLIHDVILHLGGYWEPPNIVVRLLEELAELSEVILNPNADELAAELADVWIVSTSLANRYDAKLYYTENNSNETISIADLLIQSGVIARTVNHLDGPKKPKPGEELASITDGVSLLHQKLLQFSQQHNIDLVQAIHVKLDIIKTRDFKRFEN